MSEPGKRKQGFLHDCAGIIFCIIASPIILIFGFGMKAAGTYGGVGTLLAFAVGFAIDFTRMQRRFNRRKTDRAMVRLRRADPVKQIPPGDDWI